MSDDEIDYSEIPPLDDAFFKKAALRIPGARARNWVELDPDVVRWFKAQGEGYRARINAVLHEHMRSRQR